MTDPKKPQKKKRRLIDYDLAKEIVDKIFDVLKEYDLGIEERLFLLGGIIDAGKSVKGDLDEITKLKALRNIAEKKAKQRDL